MEEARSLGSHPVTTWDPYPRKYAPDESLKTTADPPEMGSEIRRHFPTEHDVRRGNARSVQL